MKLDELITELNIIRLRNPNIPVFVRHNDNGVCKFLPIINFNNWMETLQLITTTPPAPYCSVETLHREITKFAERCGIDGTKDVVVSGIGKGKIMRICKDTSVTHPGLMVELDVYFSDDSDMDKEKRSE